MKYVATVRYGAMNYTARFVAAFPGMKMDDLVIVRSDRGVEWGHVVSIPKAVPDEECPDGLGEILRIATKEDREKLTRIEEEEEPLAMKLCQRKIEEHKLPMKLARAEKLFGGNKVVFYFLADGRVDFRALVKDLAKEYQTRIQMVQIGVRDEARLLADYEHCGRELCCRTFMRKLEPVSMKMAKSQKATLDPAKISGRCGRLMCCLRFEDQLYDELKRALPRKGARVRIEEGVGRVVATETLSQTVKVELEDDRRIVAVHVSDILERLPRKQSDAGQARPQGQKGQGGSTCPCAAADNKQGASDSAEPARDKPAGSRGRRRRPRGRRNGPK